MKLLSILLLQSGMGLPGLLFSQARQLSVGDKLTTKEMESIIHPTDTVNPTINKNAKLFIIDFWDVRCLTCIASFPQMDSIQKRFTGQLQIILVNRQTKDSTARFFNKRKKIKIPGLPFITGDSMINRYFPHVGEPYHVWIDHTGIVRLSSYGHITSIKNVENFLSTGQLPTNALAVSTNVKSLFNEQWDSLLTYYSYISHCTDNNMVRIRPEQREAMISSGGCRSAVALYKLAFNERNNPFYLYNRPGRTVLELRNPSLYIEPDRPGLYYEWAEKYAYNYHLFLPLNKNAEKFRIMREDLDRYFNLDAKVIKQKVACLVLTKTGTGDKLRSKGGVPKDNFARTDQYSSVPDSLRWYTNKPYEGFSGRLGYALETAFGKPFIDSTNIKGNIDIVITGATYDSNDLKVFNKELKQYGLELREKETWLEVLCIKERE